ncbi:non-ribosomal peptide synthetase [Nonomuraea endophytica]|uniref:Amino acid adenylation domain-containing protein n=1 Tax=Nonomuraea endophytica TaxID=714136 RepID=A0A7W8ACL1_9ACTN|nr:non-ribosomal peptide synthetase [Nonomuraea endophytica]MBB5083638.1 amino acid adenylation domain-containing protein [Nonomuraea endophytica]
MTANVDLARIFDAVDRWAADRPDATAVHAPDGSITFAELVEHTHAFAATLAAHGVGPGSQVGLCYGRGRLSLPALLATWWTGATAVPLDERHPTDRLSFVLRDSGAQVVLGDRVPAGVIPQRCEVLPASAVTAARPAPRRISPHPSGIAYVIYTSGTTGWPKGVEVPYRGLAAFVAALAALDLPTGGTGVNAVSPAFDGWLWCALLYLLNGQCMTIAGDDPADTVATARPDVVCLTPSLLLACAAEVRGAEVVVAAGEALPAALAARFTGRMLNVYGPTEATIAATCADTARGDDVTTIGRPLPGYTVHLLDADLRPVPPGVPGELFIGGPAVAAGYRHRPDLTAERFLPDPFTADGARLYRTGDLALRRPDGLLEYRGRCDEQVKIRGFRVELTEVERVAVETDGVRGAAAYVLPGRDALGLALVVSAEECLESVRTACAGRLPAAVVPAQVTAIEVLPTTPAGKVDRAALALMTAATTAHGRAPRTPSERVVAEVWGTLLPQPVHDVDADFFDLGGHSLLAARAVAALRKATGVRLTIKQLLAGPTAAGVAAELDRMGAPPAEEVS